MVQIPFEIYGLGRNGIISYNQTMQVERYLEYLKKKPGRKRISRKYQLVGLEIASLLRDEHHRSLYMKLAKEKNGDFLLQLAKDVARRPRVTNKGGYFMRMIKEKGFFKKKEV